MSNLNIAIQKNGRLHEESLALLQSCGIQLGHRKDQLKVSAPNFPLEILYLRNADIPKYLEDGVVDVAIVGENLLVEQERQVNILCKLGFSKCRVSLAVPRETATNDISFFEGKKIASSYPNTVSNFFKAHNVNAEIHTISGSTEIAPTIGLADGICDIVSSGTTLANNGLKETAIILQSEAVLAATQPFAPDKQALLDKLLFRIKSVLLAKRSKYILMNIPNEKMEAAQAILPVLKSPTVVPLAEEGWSSLHSVIDEDAFWEVLDQLKAVGAEGILVVPIDKMVL